MFNPNPGGLIMMGIGQILPSNKKQVMVIFIVFSCGK
jgi:hypothetical protein